MSDAENDYGLLVTQDIKLHRIWFKQMLKLHGINCKYYQLKPRTEWNSHGNLLGKYYDPVPQAVIFQEHPDQKTMKKMGWVSELQEGSSMIHVPYDLPGIAVGALFSIPSGIDNGKPRLFRVISMQVIMIYPASVTCEIAPEYIDDDEQVLHTDFEHTTSTLLVDDEEDD